MLRLRHPRRGGLLEDFGPALALDTKLSPLGYDYGWLLGEMYESGIIERTADTICSQAGVFFVQRKDGRLRLIFDTRQSNCYFTIPEYTELASGETLAALECNRGDRICVGSGDVECCVYQYELDP